MTGILPIKKYGTQSALSDFHEYTMLDPSAYASNVGFTEDEVQTLCNGHGMDFEGMCRWYDGYDLPGVGSVYAPSSVMEACRRRRFGSYWSSTESYISLARYIQMDFDGLQEMVAELIAGERVPAMLVELKWSKPVDGALDQIRARNYPKVLEDYGGPLLLVGITYDAKTKEHTCSIERMRK